MCKTDELITLLVTDSNFFITDTQAHFGVNFYY